MYEEARWTNKAKESFLLVKVKTNSKKSAILGLIDISTSYPVNKALNLSLKSIATKDYANLELIALISNTFKNNKIAIVKGKKSKIKVLQLA